MAGEREGFSLVELIIVIAIMAILIGVIALAVIPNIQRSRESKDLQALDNIASAVNIAVANNQVAQAGYVKITASGDVSCVLGSTQTFSAPATAEEDPAKTKIQNAVADAVTTDLGGSGKKVSISLSSSAANGYTDIYANFTVSNSSAAKVVVAAVNGTKLLKCKYTKADDGSDKLLETGGAVASSTEG